MRAGDTVKHGPTGETWVLAYVDGDRVAWCGWPPGDAALSDCELIEECSDADHRIMLATWAGKGDPDGHTDMRRIICAEQLRKLDEEARLDREHADAMEDLGSKAPFNLNG